jgi:hypothetical protein
MEPKTARITVLIDPGKKLALEKLCAEQDVTPSQVVRRLIRDYLTENGVAPSAANGSEPPSQHA